ncbi:hypothetical protein ACHAXR_012043 [Thalassiosira sp. AJA248-18]
MEVNKEEAARCRDLGADALRKGQNARAMKMFTKSLHLYPLPGVKALLGQAVRRMQSEGSQSAASGTSPTNGSSNNNNTTQTNSSFAAASRSSSTASASASSTTTGADGRAYTEAQLTIVKQVLKSKEGGRGAHYRVLGLETNADDSAIKKAYRKLALKLHPDKNSAPHADEAFKAVGLAYATLSDSQKRRIYDMSGEEDPDNRGGGMRRGGGRGGNMHFHGQDVSPEDIFNMFFGGGMPGGAGGMGGPGVRVYSSGFGGGPGMAFGGMHQRAQQQQRQRQQQQQPDGFWGQLTQFLPLLLIMMISFLNMPGDDGAGATGGSRYFSLTPVKPHVNPLSTKLSKVKDIPYFVSEQFIRTVARDRYQLSQVERMVERSYERYLLDECKNQKAYKRKLEILSSKSKISDVERANLVKKANGFDLTRCLELEDLFPQSVPQKDRVKRQHNEF